MRALSEGEREAIVNELIEGKNSQYWNILKTQIQEWKNQENRYLDKFKYNGLNQEELQIYNRSVDRLEYLDKFMDINDIVINFNRSVLEKMKVMAVETYDKAESFVKEIFE